MKSTQTISLLFLLVLTAPFVVAPFSHGKESPLLSDQELSRYGLKRGWFNQAEIDSVRSKVTHAAQEGGTLFLVSNDAKLHALDAESGKLLWMRSLGDRNMIISEPAFNSRMVAVHNGLFLSVFNRKNGKILFQTGLPGAASTAPEMSESYIYIPMLNGKLIAFPLEDSTVKFEDDPGAAHAAAAQALAEQNQPAAEPDKNPLGQEDKPEESNAEDDPVLKHIQKSFADTKNAILAEKKPLPKEPEILLKGAIGIPMVCQSFGNIQVRPTISTQLLSYTPKGSIRMHREIITWSTDKGALFAAGIEGLSQEHFKLRYMVDSSSQTYFIGSDNIAKREWTKNKDLVVRPTVNQCIPPFYADSKHKGVKIPSLVVVGNKVGYVFAVKDRTGEVAWQFSATGPILKQIAVIGTDVYCPAYEGGMHALDLITGKEKWYTPHIAEFVAASKTRLYVVDDKTRMVVLDRQTGNPLCAFDAKRFDQYLFNLENDRIYLVNKTGLVQCLYERQPGSDDVADVNTPPKPIWHRLTCKEYFDVMHGKKTPDLYWLQEKAPAEVGAEGEPAAEGEKPADGEKMEPAADDESPFGETKPAKKESGEDGMLDGDQHDDAQPKADTPKKETKKDDEDPFG